MGKVNNYQAEEAEADNYGDIRLLLATKATATTPATQLAVENGGWQVCNSQTVAEFSACAYFFGRELHKQYNVPVGLIDTSWGGTIIEAWMSREAFEGIPSQERNLKAVENLPATAEERQALYDAQYSEWLDTVNGMIESDSNTASFSSPAFDDSAWKDILMPRVASEKGTINALWWARKTVDIPQEWAGKELVLNLGTVDDNDVTYFNGTAVGNTVGCLFNRTYTIPAELVKAGKAVVAVRIHDTGGLSGMECKENDFALSLSGNADEKILLGGNWKYATAINSSALPPMPSNTANDPNFHTFLYNAMINPIVPFAIKGAIWYQGEANTGQAYQYRELMPEMINDWRTKWGYNFPFFMVQLANYMHRADRPQESAWAELREAQLKTRCTLSKTGMATIIDIGDANDIHPKNKQEVGRRLALCARAMAYGEKIGFEGPLYRGYKIENGKIRILFTRDTAKGLASSDGGALKGFEIAGPDHVWHRAAATTARGSLLVSSPEVPFPLAVRYAWADNPECNLTNSTGLPASPFRTDEWPGVSFGKTR